MLIIISEEKRALFVDEVTRIHSTSRGKQQEGIIVIQLIIATILLHFLIIIITAPAFDRNLILISTISNKQINFSKNNNN